ncbi:MAG: hypothetical protein ACJ8J0_19875, partial [Longimicrobiaceae bacterium]
DIRAHGNQPAKAVSAVRAMLATALGEFRLPGPAHVLERYAEFQAELPDLCRELGATPSELEFVELRTLMKTWIARHPVGY